jgi:deazaflavin-dependent oxidoreductase (nitroreductase family)
VTTVKRRFGARREPNRRLDVSSVQWSTCNLQQGLQSLDDHNAWPPDRCSPFHLCALPRHTGRPTCLGTASGAPRDPDWFRNLRKAKVADVQLGATTVQVRPHELIGEQRDRAWSDIILAQAPGVEKYAQRAGRTIPVAVLEPIQGKVACPLS